MIKFDEKCIVRTTFETGQRLNFHKAAREMWNIVCTTKEVDGKDALVLRDPRLPVAVLHPKGSITISGNHTIQYACKCLKIVANTLLQQEKRSMDTDAITQGHLFRVNYIIGRFRIKTEHALDTPSQTDSFSRYHTIQKLLNTDPSDRIIETGWNVNMIDLLLSRKYDWCVKHGIVQVFSSKKSSKKYELEMEVKKFSSPGAATISFRMNEHGEFRYTILLKEHEFTASSRAFVDENEARDVRKVQSEIDAAVTHLNDFITSFYSDIMTQCRKQKLIRSRV
mmetsp:Transcript_29370/g.45389  ORF Transcript_29370/g.45389 Transcript_29370/m.45389 type:complete len:281 (-) Transcript_29370:63-905(-)